MKILYLRGKFPYAKFQPPILKTVDLLEEHTEEDFSPFLASDQKSKFMSQCKLHVFSLIFRASFLLLNWKNNSGDFWKLDLMLVGYLFTFPC